MVHVGAALGGRPFGIVFQQLDIELVQPSRGPNVERAFSDLLDGGDACQGQEESEMIGKLSILARDGRIVRSEEHTSELQSLMRISYAVFCLKKKHIKRQ